MANGRTASGTEEGRSEPAAERYDVAVVGAGIGGLTAGALLAREGKRVVVVEQGEGAGGCVHSFRRGPYRLDPAVHLVVDPAHLSRLLEHLDVADRVDFVDPPHFYSAVGPGFHVTAPFGRDAFIDAHVERFGEQVRPFLDTCVHVHERLHDLPGRLGLGELEASMRDDPRFLRLLKATLAEAIEGDLPTGDARIALGLPGLYLGLPPRELSFRTYSQMLLAHVVHRAALVEGGLQRVIDAIAASLERDGSELVLGRRVTGIRTEDGRATGVRLDDGRELAASAVISNADPLQTFEQLVGLERLPDKYVKRLRRLGVSHSAFTVFAATRMDLARFPHASHLMFVTSEPDLEHAFELGLDGRPVYASLCIPTMAEPEAAPAGEHLIMAVTTAAYDPGRPWDELREAYADAMLALMEDTFPGIRESLTFTETATPIAIERHTANREGAIYAWGNSPSGIGSRPPGNDTPIEGLFLAGAWTAPGSGFARCLGSAQRAAQLVLEATGSEVELPRFMS